jgi:predicted nucleic acid-binding protein
MQHFKWESLKDNFNDFIFDSTIIFIDNSVCEFYNCLMEIVSDASVFLTVVLNEMDREWVIEKTSGYSIVSPEVLPYEVGNALIAMKRNGRLNDREILRAFNISQRIAVKLVRVAIHAAIKIAIRFNIYAYDAYYLQCCIENRLPLISLDGRMCGVAESLGIKVVN